MSIILTPSKKNQKHFLVILFILLSLFIQSCSSILIDDRSESEIITSKIEELKTLVNINSDSFGLIRGSKLVNYNVNQIEKEITLDFNKNLSYQEFREQNTKELYEKIRTYIGGNAEPYSLKIKSIGIPIEEFIPNIFRYSTKIDSSRLFKYQGLRPNAIVTNISKPINIKNGLSNRNIALWHSHGLYYNYKLDRWMFQRARLFQTIEDLGPMAFTIPYIIPMLENAGANVFVPRERDVQTNEVIIDDELDDDNFIIKSKNDRKWIKGNDFGFGKLDKIVNSKTNPFKSGTYSTTLSSLNETSSATYIPDMPEEGEYAVYISYKSLPNSSPEVTYTIRHLGGETKFSINQKIGGGTWIYLGTFKFPMGKNSDFAALRISNKTSVANEVISTDAVRFGGGYGIIERNGKTSGKPKFLEGARYWLQFAGINDSLVFNINGDSLDYKDDYQSRGEWVNYLIGAPFGPNINREADGLGIPIDISLAFHTDAGISSSDTTIGTLAIYSIPDIDSNNVFPNGISRLANRDFTDILQTQIVDDIKSKYDPVWRKRELRDALYSEAARPNVPSALLELLSHQNFLDNKFQLDPRFKFDVSRAIYKSILKFINSQSNTDFVVQPLPPNHFATSLTDEGNILLEWKAQLDPLEETAVPSGYLVYTKKGDGGFDNGIYVKDTSFLMQEFDENEIYSFKVTAINDGGESFPTEILSACSFGKGVEPLLIVNGFDRVSAPIAINEPNFSGFLSMIDAGVPDKYDIGFTGIQHNYNPNSNWNTDDNPGHGASYADYESKIIAGNTFNYPELHGKSIKAAGYPFVSSSDESVWSGMVNLESYKFVDFIMGEEKETPWPKAYGDSLLGKQFEIFPDKLKEKITDYLNSNGNIFISGAYIGSDLFDSKNDSDIDFARNVLKYKLNTGHAVRTGEVYSTNQNILTSNVKLKFNTELSSKLYAVEAPDAIGAINGSENILRYSENSTSAGVLFKQNYGVAALGFPFESIIDVEVRDELIKNILKYLLSDGNKK